MTSYPWLVFSSEVRDIQREINGMRVALDSACPILVEDGKLGPATCSAAKVYSSRSGTVAGLLGSCKSYNDAAIANCLVLPWMQPSLETVTFQRALNSVLVPQGYCKIKEDGVLGPETCGAAQQVLGATFTKVGCQSPSMLKVCAATSNPEQPVAPVPSVMPPAPTEATALSVPSAAPESQEAPVLPVVAPESEEQEVLVQGSRNATTTTTTTTATTDTAPKKENSAFWWIVGGLAVAGVAGAYVVAKRKQRRR
jgi:hypothetical protein